MAEHGPECGCTRCRGFEPGHSLSIRHGAYASPLRLADRAAEIADAIRPHLPVAAAAAESILQTYAVTLVRVERAGAALDEAEARLLERGGAISTYTRTSGDDLMGRLRTDLRLWIQTAVKLADALGLTPTAQARLGLDLALGQNAAQRALERHLEQTHQEPDA